MKRNKKGSGATFALGALLLCGLAANAPAVHGADKLPGKPGGPHAPNKPLDPPPGVPAAARSAEQILADAIAATGNEAAWNKHKNLTMTLTVSIKAMGINGKATMTQTSRDQFHMEVELPVVGKMQTASDGKQVWSHDPINGLRILTGAEAEQARLQSTWKADLRVRELFQSIRAIPSADPALECVELTARESSPIKRCFDRKSHLNTTIEMEQISPQGKTPARMSLSDYRAVGGVKFPYRTTTVAGPMLMEMTVNTIKWDAKLKPAMFNLPQAKK